MKRIVINNGKVISEKGSPFIVTEAGVNYYDIAEKEGIEPIEAAKLMIDEAAKAGADAIKFQTYKAEKLVSRYSPAYWNTKKEKIKNQYELFKKYDRLEEEDYKELSKYARNRRIIFMSTPFDEEAADFLENLMPIYKISSADITNLPFIKYIAKKMKPIFLSTGASTINEIKDAINAIIEEGNRQIVILHCILSYPTTYENANLGMICDLQKKFPEYLVGYSDHTPPDPHMLVLTTAVLLGAVVIEKHFTLDKTLPGNDHYHSMDPSDLIKFIKNIKLIEKIIGLREKKPIGNEYLSRKYARRSIVAKDNIPKGITITQDMLTFKRPGTGISPRDVYKIIGKKSKRDIKRDEIIRWEDIK